MFWCNCSHVSESSVVKWTCKEPSSSCPIQANAADAVSDSALVYKHELSRAVPEITSAMLISLSLIQRGTVADQGNARVRQCRHEQHVT